MQTFNIADITNAKFNIISAHNEFIISKIKAGWQKELSLSWDSEHGNIVRFHLGEWSQGHEKIGDWLFLTGTALFKLRDYLSYLNSHNKFDNLACEMPYVGDPDEQTQSITHEIWDRYGNGFECVLDKHSDGYEQKLAFVKRNDITKPILDLRWWRGDLPCGGISFNKAEACVLMKYLDEIRERAQNANMSMAKTYFMNFVIPSVEKDKKEKEKSKSKIRVSA